MALDEKWFPVRRDTVQLPSGKVLDDFFVWDAGHFVTVVPITADGKFVLIQQYRHAIATIDCQFPAGAADKGDNDAETAARRELEEETGYIGGSWRRLYRVSPFGHKMSDISDIFLAEGVTAEGVIAHDDAEDIAVLLKTPAELRAMIANNEIISSTSMVGALLALQHLGKS